MRAILHHPELTQPLTNVPEPPKPRRLQRNRQQTAPLTLACDFTFLLITVGAGLVFHAVVLAVWPPNSSPFERDLVQQLFFWSVTTTAAGFLLRDGVRCLRPESLLPFDYIDNVVRQIYWQRWSIILWAIASHLVLMCLCLLLPTSPFFSKLFLSSMIGLAALAVYKSIPAPKLAFAAATGVFSLAMLVITVAGAWMS